jgi:GT2 family glycosyltransferase
MLKTIAALIACHNRKDQTLNCLQALFNQIGMGIAFKLEVFLVDDGCTDGTAEAIRQQFPQVTIIKGTGNLYWNRGMHLAWQSAAATSQDFDYYLWLNDDTFLYENAISTLLQTPINNAIVCGTTQSEKNLAATYGGFSNKSNQLLIPNRTYQKSNFCNGNCVLIPKKVYERVGNFDPIFHHALGDFDYCLRARKMGIEIVVAPDYIGICELHNFIPSWRDPKIPIAMRLKQLYTPASGCYPTEFFVFDKRHNGLLVAWFHYFTIHLRAIVPALWKYKN